MEYETLTRQIIGCAYTVYNKLGAGFLESIYERGLAIELARAGLSTTCQTNIPVYYDEHLVDEFKADLIVNDTVIVELKAVEALAKAHEVQLMNYLVATHKPVGLLINFGPKTVAVKRKLRDLPDAKVHPVNRVNPEILSNSNHQGLS